MRVINWLKRFSAVLRSRLNQSMTPIAPLCIPAPDSAGMSDVMLTMEYIYGSEMASVCLVSMRLER